MPANTTKKIFKQGEYSAVDKKAIPQNRISTQLIILGLKIRALKTSLLRDQWPIMALLIRGSWSRTTIHPLKIQEVLIQSIEILVSTGKRLMWSLQGELSLANRRANKSISLWNPYEQLRSVYRECCLQKKKSKQKIWLSQLDQYLQISQKSWKIWHKAIRRCLTRSFRKKNLIDLQHWMKEMGSQWSRKQFSSSNLYMCKLKYHLKRTKRRRWPRNRFTLKRWSLLTIPNKKTILNKEPRLRRRSREQADLLKIRAHLGHHKSDRQTNHYLIINNLHLKDLGIMSFNQNRLNSLNPKIISWIEPFRKKEWTIQLLQTKNHNHLSLLILRTSLSQVQSSMRFSIRGLLT